jgi:hypothetical protein
VLRRFLNAKLAGCKKALLPLRDLCAELKAAFGSRRICIARFGQKAALSPSLSKLLESLSQKFEVSVAIAAELRLPHSYISASSAGFKLDSCFPFLFSPLATNVELKKADSCSKVPGSYRWILLIKAYGVQYTAAHKTLM